MNTLEQLANEYKQSKRAMDGSILPVDNSKINDSVFDRIVANYYITRKAFIVIYIKMEGFFDGNYCLLELLYLSAQLRN